MDDLWPVGWDKTLSVSWTGKAYFEMLRPEPPVGHPWVAGWSTKTQETTRPPCTWPEQNGVR